MNKCFCQTLGVMLSVLSSGVMPEAMAVAGHSLVTEQSTVSNSPSLMSSRLEQPVGTDEEIRSTTDRPTQEKLSVSDLSAERAKENTFAPDSGAETTPMAQVNSVSGLTDVQSTDWAFQALQSLVERYGCIEGYPNRTYGGNRALTRYEFAAGLNKCLDRLGELITTSTNSVRKEDLVTLQRLQADFAAELANLRGRIDAVETRTASIEQQQFSTTTKLRGQVLTFLGDAFGEDAGKANNTTFHYRARLTFDTSFTGKDDLIIGLQSINYRGFNTATKFPQGRLSGPTDETRVLGNSITQNGELRPYTLAYRFPLGDKLIVNLDAYSSSRLSSDPITPIGNLSTGAVSYYGQINPMLFPVYQQSGITLQWLAARWLNIDVSWGGEGPTNDPTVGLFTGGYGASVRPVLSLGRLKLTGSYINSYSPQNGIDTTSGSNAAKVIGAGPVVGNTYIAGAFYRFNPTFELGGSVGYSNARALGNGTKGDAHVSDYRVNFIFYDVGKKGNLAGLIVGTEPRLISTSNGALAQAIGLPPGQRSDRDVGLHIEAFYAYRLSDHIVITPGVFWLTAPNHDARNADAVIGVIRTSLSF